MNHLEKNEIQHDVYVSLKEYFTALRVEQDRRIDRELVASRSAVDAALVAAKEAVTKAELAQERRLDLLNEFRQQSVDEQAKFAIKEIVDDRLGRLERTQAQLFGGLAAVTVIGIANLVKLFFG